MSLEGKVALITGGSKGIGRATALRLAREGASVVINYATDTAGAKEVVSEIGSDKALAIQADASKVDAINDMVEQTVARFGKIDILLPFAGMMAPSPLEATSEELFDKMFALNVKGPYFLCKVRIRAMLVAFSILTSSLCPTTAPSFPPLCNDKKRSTYQDLAISNSPPRSRQAAAPHMPASSHIVLISTTLVAASTVQPPYLPYLATKGAIEQMTRVMSKDLGRRGICVNCVAPGPTSTKLFMAHQTDATLKFLGGLNPNGRIGEPEEVANAIALLCGKDSRWVMGQVLRVNGGMA